MWGENGIIRAANMISSEYNTFPGQQPKNMLLLKPHSFLKPTQPHDVISVRLLIVQLQFSLSN